MKTIVVLAVVVSALCFLHGSTGSPLYGDETEGQEQLANIDVGAVYDGSEDGETGVQIREKRATCDLLSGLGYNHAPCAAHCLLRGKRGGYCNGQAVCVCRN